MPTRPPEPGVSPCPTGSGAASPAPRAGKRCGASHPNSPKPQRSGERSHPAPGARKHFQLWGHPTLTFPHLSDPFRALGMGAGTSPRSGSCPAAREPLTAAPPAEGLERSFSRVCQGERLPTPAWEEIPPLPEGPGPRLQIKWKWGIQRLQRPAAEGKNRRSCSLRPSSFLSPPYPPLLSSNTCPGDPSSSPRPLPGAPRPARCQQQGEGQGG